MFNPTEKEILEAAEKLVEQTEDFLTCEFWQLAGFYQLNPSKHIEPHKSTL